MNLAERIQLSCQKYGSKRLFFDDQVITYEELWNKASQAAGVLKRRGIKPGDRVALQLPKCLEFLYFHLGNIQIGGITVPLNPAYTREEISYFLNDSGASLYITDEDYADYASPASSEFPALKEIIVLRKDGSEFDFAASGRQDWGLRVDNGTVIDDKPLIDSRAFSDAASKVSPEDTALLIYTSGTTGRSKGAMLSHANILATVEALHQIWGHSEQDVLLHVLPVFHVHGLIFAFYGALYAGMEIVMRSRFDPEDALRCIEQHKCTVFMGVPTMYYRLLRAVEGRRFDTSSMRLWISGSAPLPANIFEEFRQVFGQAILERYGMSETGINTSNPLQGERKAGSVGIPLPEVEVKVVDAEGKEVPRGEVGEVWVKGKNVFKGYWQMPEKTAEAFAGEWFKTGDLGYFDTDGYLFLVGRARDLIISGGMNVYPKEVEAVIESLPGVEEAAVVGLPDADLGERVTAFIVPRAGETISPEAVISLCRQKLAAYKCPRQVYILDQLPRNTMGKVLKSELRKWIF